MEFVRFACDAKHWQPHGGLYYKAPPLLLHACHSDLISIYAIHSFKVISPHQAVRGISNTLIRFKYIGRQPSHSLLVTLSLLSSDHFTHRLFPHVLSCPCSHSALQQHTSTAKQQQTRLILLEREQGKGWKWVKDANARTNYKQTPAGTRTE